MLMEEKIKFGEIKAKELKIGDIVSWSKWNVETENWDEFMGVLLDTRNELVGNRLVSVSKVMPLSFPLLITIIFLLLLIEFNITFALIVLSILLSEMSIL